MNNNDYETNHGPDIIRCSMRLISQNGAIDVPYESGMVMIKARDTHGRYAAYGDYPDAEYAGTKFDIAFVRTDRQQVIAQYGTIEKALAAMNDITDAYALGKTIMRLPADEES